MSIIRRAPAQRFARSTAAGLACLIFAAGATSDPPVAGPLGGGQSVTLEPAPPPANPRRHRAVFVCQESGVPVLCARLERQLDELNDRMRAGYSAREAAKLWQRWRDTKERLRTGRC